jgi:hypothetical protein
MSGEKKMGVFDAMVYSVCGEMFRSEKQRKFMHSVYSFKSLFHHINKRKALPVPSNRKRIELTVVSPLT